MSAVVERIEKYTTRERERLERGKDTPPMKHIVRKVTVTTALCGASYQPNGGDYRNADCVVCRDLVVRMGWRL